MNAIQILLYILLAVLGLVSLFIWLFGRYAKICRTLPDGSRILLGYVWKWGGKYVIYDGIPLLWANRLGMFDTSNNVYLMTENAQYNHIEQKYGSFDDQGNIFGLNGNNVATCNSLGKSSRETAAQVSGVEVAFAKTGLRKGDDLLVRAAAAGVLYILAHDDEKILQQDVRIGFKDLALPSALIFMMLYVPFSLIGITANVMDSIGNEFFFILYMLLVYLFICWSLLFVKKFMTMRNRSLTYILGLIDCNVGVSVWNWTIIVGTAILLIASLCIQNYTMFPLFLTLLIGFIANLGCFQRDWHVVEPCATWNAKWMRTTNATTASVMQTPGQKIIEFEWAPILEAKGISQHNNEKVSIVLTEQDFELQNGRVRKMNPFGSAQPQSEEDLENKVREVLLGCDDQQNEEKNAIVAIINSAYQICKRYNLADFELYDLILLFCQHSIDYKTDDKSDSIGNIGEYFRYAAETLYDGEGDCDCKSVLAYKIFEALGVKSNLVFAKTKGQLNYNHVAVVLHRDSMAVVSIPDSYPQYKKGLIYCELTGCNYMPGVIPSDVDARTLKIV